MAGETPLEDPKEGVLAMFTEALSHLFPRS